MVGVLPCVPPEQVHAFSLVLSIQPRTFYLIFNILYFILVHSERCILQVPILNFRRLDVPGSDKELRAGGPGPEDDAMEDGLLNPLAFPIPISREQAFVFGIVVVVNAYSSDNLMSRQLYCMKLSYEIGSHQMYKCMGRSD